MDGVRGLAGVPTTKLVQERNAGGNRQQSEAFRRALQQRAESAGDGTAAEPERQPPGSTDQPVRRALQPQYRDGRKNEGVAHHVDVIA